MAMSKWFTIIYLIVEVLAFIALGEWIGYGWTVLLVAGLFIAGLAFAAIEFKRIYQKLLVTTSRTLTEYGEKAPEEALKRSAKGAGHFVADSAILLVGSWLIALPSVVSTVAGFLMVLPPIRLLVRKTASVGMLNWFRRMGDRSMLVVSQYGTRIGDSSTASDIRSFPKDRIVPPAPDNAWNEDDGNTAFGGKDTRDAN